MALHQFFAIKAISKHTGDIHYVKIDSEGFVGLEDKVHASLYERREQAEEAIENYCEGEQTHSYIVEPIIVLLDASNE